jgi:serine/threonine-protein kinase RsbW
VDTDVEWMVGLDVPADTRHLHVIRLTAAGAAAEAGLSAEEVEDVKIAVDELCSLFIAAAEGSRVGAGPDRIGLRFEASARGLTIEAPGPPSGAIEVDELARTILDATLDELAVGPEADHGGFRLVKRRSGR